MELGIRKFLRRPVTRQDIERVIDNFSRSSDVELCGDISEISDQKNACAVSTTPAVPVIEELGRKSLLLGGFTGNAENL